MQHDHLPRVLGGTCPNTNPATKSRRLAVTCFRALTCSPVIPATHMARTPPSNPPRSVSTRYVPAPALMNRASINKPRCRGIARGSHMHPSLCCDLWKETNWASSPTCFDRQNLSLLVFSKPDLWKVKENGCLDRWKEGGKCLEEFQKCIKVGFVLQQYRFLNRVLLPNKNF